MHGNVRQNAMRHWCFLGDPIPYWIPASTVSALRLSGYSRRSFHCVGAATDSLYRLVQSLWLLSHSNICKLSNFNSLLALLALLSKSLQPVQGMQGPQGKNWVPSHSRQCGLQFPSHLLCTPRCRQYVTSKPKNYIAITITCYHIVTEWNKTRSSRMGLHEMMALKWSTVSHSKTTQYHRDHQSTCAKSAFLHKDRCTSLQIFFFIVDPWSLGLARDSCPSVHRACCQVWAEPGSKQQLLQKSLKHTEVVLGLLELLYLGMLWASFCNPLCDTCNAPLS